LLKYFNDPWKVGVIAAKPGFIRNHDAHVAEIPLRCRKTKKKIAAKGLSVDRVFGFADLKKRRMPGTSKVIIRLPYRKLDFITCVLNKFSYSFYGTVRTLQ